MNELDKKIAELKGWSQDSGGAWFDQEMNQLTVDKFLPQWSTSDAKAFELVDEIIGVKPNRLKELGFALYHKIKYPYGERSIRFIEWEASFYIEVDDKKIKEVVHESGISRPEAICRAYIAAVEWMKEKK